MSKALRKENPVLSLINEMFIELPSPSNINYLWNLGSLLGISLIIQIVTGIFLAMHYCPDVNLAFSSVAHITRDINYGFILRYLHANGASMFFLCVYCLVCWVISYSVQPQSNKKKKEITKNIRQN